MSNWEYKDRKKIFNKLEDEFVYMVDGPLEQELQYLAHCHYKRAQDLLNNFLHRMKEAHSQYLSNDVSHAMQRAQENTMAMLNAVFTGIEIAEGK